MRTYHFTEAEHLTTFIKENKEKILGCCLHQLYTDYWPCHQRTSISDIPVVIVLSDYYLIIKYLIPSDIEITIGTKDEIVKDDEIAHVISLKNDMVDYYCEEFGDGIKKELIENCKIEDIQVERFSDAFECNTNGDMRPKDGDYFSTIRVFLDSGKVLCFCGADSVLDGYIEIWCE